MTITFPLTYKEHGGLQIFFLNDLKRSSTGGTAIVMADCP